VIEQREVAAKQDSGLDRVGMLALSFFLVWQNSIRE